MCQASKVHIRITYTIQMTTARTTRASRLRDNMNEKRFGVVKPFVIIDMRNTVLFHEALFCRL